MSSLKTSELNIALLHDALLSTPMLQIVALDTNVMKGCRQMPTRQLSCNTTPDPFCACLAGYNTGVCATAEPGEGMPFLANTLPTDIVNAIHVNPCKLMMKLKFVMDGCVIATHGFL